MKNYFLFILTLFVCGFICKGQSIDLMSKSIDSILLVNAHAVKKYEKSELIVYDLEKALYQSKQVYTILDVKGEHFLSFVEYTDKFRKLEDFSIVTYNLPGLPVKTYTKKDLQKDASNSGLVEDNIIYHLKLSTTSYPVTVEFNYSIKYKGILNYPSFEIQSPDESVKHAEYTATIPKQLGLRYFNQATNIKPVITEQGENTIYTWEVNNLPAFKNDEGSVSWESRFPKVIIAPNLFKLDDYAGEMGSWQSFGKWYATLASKSLDLTENSKTYMRSMVSHTTDNIEKARIIYDYLQSNFRYVSIQLGIGGFKPFPASFTDTKKYGDCKALSHYMQACLAAVNIKSYQALINAGNNKAPVNRDFPVNAFNHVILCIPMANDSLWLECTSSYNDFGKLGSFTENRNALLITENGGVLVATPSSMASENKFLSKETVQLKEDGSGTANADLYSTGEYKSRIINWIHNESKADQKNAILYMLDMPAPEKFELKIPGNTKSSVLETGLELSFEKIPAFKAGSKMFLNKHLFKIWNMDLPNSEPRKMDYYFSHPFERIDTSTFKLPAGFTIESLPKPIKLSFKYGAYESKTWLDEKSGAIISISSLILNKHIIPAEDFMETKKFFMLVTGDEIQKIIIKN